MIVRVRVQSQAIKGKDTGNGRQVALAPLLQKSLSQNNPPLMSADPNAPLFMISDGDNIKYEDDPAIAQAKANLMAVEQIQQERAEQRRLEREERKVWAEAERLRWEIKEAEREQRELEEAEVERLTQEKEKLEEENRVEQWHAAALCGLERAVEWRQVALAALPPEAGPSWAPPRKPEQTTKGAHQGPGIIMPEINCMRCITQESLCRWDPEGHAWSCQLC